jgi:hypothetical protein
VQDVRASFDFDESGYLGSGEYAKELLALAADKGLVALIKLHGGAFGWSPPDVAGLERLGATRMRQYVRSWINEWDLVRLDPSFLPQTEVISIATDYREDTALESTAEPVPGDLGYQDRADGAAAGSEEEIH